MRLEDFDFDLPDEAIALHPAVRRDAARLLHVQADRMDDRHIYDLPQLFNDNDVLVVNDSRVIPARIFGEHAGRRYEVLLHQAIGGGAWRCFVRKSRKLVDGDRLVFVEGLMAEVMGRESSGELRLQFSLEGKPFEAWLARHGSMPLPPYIKRDAVDTDSERYQTVYADRPGSVAAPTAGLHFTPELLETIKRNGTEIHRVTLHVGAGTFQPVAVEDVANHVMHSEWAELTGETANALNRARENGKRITAVGTTACRTLESAADEQGVLHAMARSTDIFIRPGYRFRAVERLLTNFHLPRSTLFMLVSAFSGRERMQQAYQHAIDSGYRFYSYGDACLLERLEP